MTIPKLRPRWRWLPCYLQMSVASVFGSIWTRVPVLCRVKIEPIVPDSSGSLTSRPWTPHDVYDQVGWDEGIADDDIRDFMMSNVGASHDGLSFEVVAVAKSHFWRILVDNTSDQLERSKTNKPKSTSGYSWQRRMALVIFPVATLKKCCTGKIVDIPWILIQIYSIGKGRLWVGVNKQSLNTKL